MSAAPSEWPVSGSDRPVPEALARTLRHEIAVFLQQVYANVALLENRLPPEWDLEREMLKRLQKRAESCKHLLDAIQDFLCPISANRETFDLSKLLAGKVAEFQEQHPRLHAILQTQAPIFVQADPDKIEQVASILLANAAESTGDTAVVAIRALPTAGQIEWTIADNGPGVPPEIFGRLFAPFLTTKTGHAGLGLALARKFMSVQEGDITAQNLPHGGFQIRLVLPAGTP